MLFIEFVSCSSWTWCCICINKISTIWYGVITCSSVKKKKKSMKHNKPNTTWEVHVEALKPIASFLSLIIQVAYQFRCTWLVDIYLLKCTCQIPWNISLRDADEMSVDYAAGLSHYDDLGVCGLDEVSYSTVTSLNLCNIHMTLQCKIHQLTRDNHLILTLNRYV